MKKRRLLVVLCMILAVCLVLPGCTTKSPTDEVKEELESVKNESDDTLDEVFNVDEDDLYISSSNRSAYNEFTKKIRDFDYDISDENIADSGNTAEVTVKITTYDFGTAAEEFYSSQSSVSSGGISGILTDDSTAAAFLEKMNSVSGKNYEKTVKVTCTKDDDGEWSVDLDNNYDLADAISGGLLSTLK